MVYELSSTATTNRDVATRTTVQHVRRDTKRDTLAIRRDREEYKMSTRDVNPRSNWHVRIHDQPISLKKNIIIEEKTQDDCISTTQCVG